MFVRRLIYFLALFSVVCFPYRALAEMSSSIYTIYADTVGVNGGNFSSSVTYALQDTLGETPTGFTTSTTYELRGGYQAMERGILSMTISNSSVSLGSLTVSAVNSASTDITIGTDAATGYSLSVGAVSGSMPTSVSDGAVTAGAEEYGVAASGSNALISGDVAVAPSLAIAATSTPVSGDATTLTFKASRSSGSVAGAYSQSITLTASANF